MLWTLIALFASCIGIGSARCYSEDERLGKEVPLNFLRTGEGTNHFTCDVDNAAESDDDRGRDDTAHQPNRG
jgi:hypothetical protein